MVGMQTHSSLILYELQKDVGRGGRFVVTRKGLRSVFKEGEGCGRVGMGWNTAGGSMLVEESLTQ